MEGTVDKICSFCVLQNFQDLEAEKAIMGSIVYCIHHKDGCKWSDELRKLKVTLYFSFLFVSFDARTTIFTFYMVKTVLYVVQIIEEFREQRACRFPISE